MAVSDAVSDSDGCDNVFSWVRDIESWKETYAAWGFFILCGKGVSREEQSALAVYAADVQGVRAHVARPHLRAEQRALARAARGAAVRAARRGALRARRRRHRRAQSLHARRPRCASEGFAWWLTTASTYLSAYYLILRLMPININLGLKLEFAIW